MEICKINQNQVYGEFRYDFGTFWTTGSHWQPLICVLPTSGYRAPGDDIQAGKKHNLDMHGQSWAIQGSCLFLPAPELNGRPMMTFDDLEFEQVSCIWGSLASFILNREFEEVPCRRLALQSVVVLQMLQLAPTLAQ